MSQLPYMPLYCDALAGDTLGMSREAFGSYLLILTAMWCNNAELDNDDAQLARIARCTVEEWQATKPLIWGKLQVYEDSQGNKKISQKRLKKEWGKSSRRYTSCVLNGAKGLEARKCGASKTMGPKKQPNSTSTSENDPSVNQPANPSVDPSIAPVGHATILSKNKKETKEKQLKKWEDPDELKMSAKRLGMTT